MLDLGLLEKVESRVYRLTVKGLQQASELSPETEETREKVDRELEHKVRGILNHKVFSAWIKDSKNPRTFRGAGQFWGVAPGTPPRVIKDRIQWIDDVLDAARSELDRRGVDVMVDRYAKTLFDRDDLKRSAEFNQALKVRFRKDLEVLGVKLDGSG